MVNPIQNRSADIVSLRTNITPKDSLYALALSECIAYWKALVQIREDDRPLFLELFKEEYNYLTAALLEAHQQLALPF